jgi:hypothetical protein
MKMKFGISLKEKLLKKFVLNRVEEELSKKRLVREIIPLEQVM